MNNDDNGEEEVRKGPLSPLELTSVRHIINNYYYRRKIRKMLKVWIYTIGTVTTVMVGGMTLFKEIVSRLMK